MYGYHEDKTCNEDDESDFKDKTSKAHSNGEGSNTLLTGFLL